MANNSTNSINDTGTRAVKIDPVGASPIEKEEIPAVSPPVSRNVYLMLLLCVLWGFSDSIWTGTIIVSWVQLLSGGENAPHSNAQVGYVEATQGMAMLLTALPVGYLADKYSRQMVIRAGSVGFFIATIMTLFALLNPFLWNNDRQYVIILIAMGFWGIGQGIFNGPSQALFADSIPKGERTKWYSRLLLCYIIPSIAGPITAIILLTVYGDKWTFKELRPVFLFGVVAELPPSLLSFFMRDDLALNNGGDGDGDGDGDGGDGDGNVGDHENVENVEEEKMKNNDERMIDPSNITNGNTTTSSCCCVQKQHVPYILFASSLLTALGSGMTIKFFPLFFKKNLKLTPRGVQCIYAISPLLIAIFTKMNESIAKCIGRVQTILLASFFGISFLVCMSLLIDFGISTWYIIIPIYLVRTGIMNSTYALNESILMDYVPKETRARWKSLESVASFGWCGSAVVGGLLSDASSYSTTFMYTAGLQLIGALIIAFLLKVVPIEEEDGNGKKTRRSIIDSSNSDNIESGSKIMYNNGSTDDLEEPLLS